MAKQFLALFLFALACFLVLNNASGQPEVKKWCIAKPSSDSDQLQKNIDYACANLPEPDCPKLIGRGSPCYSPTNKVASASVVMNQYFQRHGEADQACYFNSSGLIISENPSVGACRYPPY